MALSAVMFGLLLRNFSELRLIQVIQGSAVLTIVVNVIALWKQEPRGMPTRAVRASFSAAWAVFSQTKRMRRRLLATALGTAGFSMQDILLEPYGGKILHLPVSATTALTAALALGGACGLMLAARRIANGEDPHRVAGFGALAGLAAFACVMFAAPAESQGLFSAGVALIGFGGGLFGHGTLTAFMDSADSESRGLALGAWGAAQATAAGLAIAASGFINDVGSALAVNGALGEALESAATGYALVYAIEIVLLLATLVAVGPLVRAKASRRSPGFGPGSPTVLNPGG
jgi:BCD family chlorophyll transporter-like MFS transporter